MVTMVVSTALPSATDDTDTLYWRGPSWFTDSTLMPAASTKSQRDRTPAA